ncbi:hypothetical protein GCM10010289_73240 [Streptomyces violascens]|nr:hypothetical protein GCM10010289_73240 [Streptomyces violascens]
MSKSAADRIVNHLGPALTLQPRKQFRKDTVLPRGHVEPVTIGGKEHTVKLGVWMSDKRTRRTKLSGEQRGRLAELGMDWAQDG